MHVQLALQLCDQGGGKRFIELHHTLTGDTQEMVVVGRRMGIKSTLALLAVKPLWAHQPLTLQPMQRAIDGREIQRGIAHVRVAVDLFRGWMAGKRLD